MITKQVRSSVALLEVNDHIQVPSARIWIYLNPQLFLVCGFGHRVQRSFV